MLLMLLENWDVCLRNRKLTWFGILAVGYTHNMAGKCYGILSQKRSLPYYSIHVLDS